MTLEPHDVGFLAQATLALLAARVALRLFPLASLARFSARLAVNGGRLAEGSPTRERSELTARLAWSVDAVSARLGGLCLARSVTLHWLLSRHGIAGRLAVGFPRRGDPLAGHAWVEVDGEPLGADGAALRGHRSSCYDVLLSLPDPSRGA